MNPFKPTVIMNPFKRSLEGFGPWWILGGITMFIIVIVMNGQALNPEAPTSLLPYASEKAVGWEIVYSMLFVWATVLAVGFPALCLMAKKRCIRRDQFKLHVNILIYGILGYVSFAYTAGILVMHLFVFLVNLIVEINPSKRIDDLFWKLSEARATDHDLY